MKTHSVNGGGGVKLHVREWGRPDAPAILFIHGWSQTLLCWRRQYESTLADRFRLVAFDLRGHGLSEAPRTSDAYTEAQLWADDIAAIIMQLDLKKPALVGWSYAGFVICDYLQFYGQNGICGVNFVGAAVMLDNTAFEVLIGPGFLQHVAGATSDDLLTSIQAMRAFVSGCTARPLPRDDYEIALCWNMVVPAKVRAALVSRQIDCTNVLRSLTRPVLMSHGLHDGVVLPAMGKFILEACPTSSASWYPEAGHLPFLEEPLRFNNELGDFVSEASINCRA